MQIGHRPHTVFHGSLGTAEGDSETHREVVRPLGYEDEGCLSSDLCALRDMSQISGRYLSG